MKKLLSLLLALTMVLSLAACGAEEVAVETEAELTAEEVVAVLAESMPNAFIGVDDSDCTYYMMFDEEISYGALCILDSEATTSMVTIGNVTEDTEGVLTITDDQDDYFVSFLVEALEENGESYLQLTMADGAVVTMVAEDAAEVADMILTIELNTEVIVPTAE